MGRMVTGCAGLHLIQVQKARLEASTGEDR